MPESNLYVLGNFTQNVIIIIVIILFFKYLKVLFILVVDKDQFGKPTSIK